MTSKKLPTPFQDNATTTFGSRLLKHRWQWCYDGDSFEMSMAELLCWWPFLLYRHLQKLSPTSVTNIDFTKTSASSHHNLSLKPTWYAINFWHRSILTRVPQKQSQQFLYSFGLVIWVTFGRLADSTISYSLNEPFINLFLTKNLNLLPQKFCHRHIYIIETF